MALKKVKLPNNTTVDINDARVVSDAIVYKGEELGDATYTSGGAVVDLSDYQPLLVSGTSIKTINNQSLLGSGNISISGGSGGGGEENVIEVVKQNGTALTVTDKAVNVTVPTKVSDLTNDSGFTSNAGTITGITMNNTSKGTSGVVDLGTVVTDVSGKEDTSNKVSSLPAGNYSTEYMQSHYPSLYYLGTALGNFELTSRKITSWPYDETTHESTATDTQYPSAKLVLDTLSEYNDITQFTHDYSSESYITNISQIGWDAPEGSIVRIDSTHAYERYNGSWVEWTGPSSGGGGEANVIEGVTFNGTTAPITNKIAAITASIPTESTVSGWGFTKNAGTITGITMNGSSKGTSGVVNLGTVVTSETDPVFSASAAAGITSSNISAWNAKQNAITISSSEPTSSQGSNGDIWIVV